MTGNSNKTRAVILAALMVFSVFAGTVAFTGSAAAQAEYAGGAVEYENSSDVWIIEVPVQDGSIDNTTVTSNNVELTDDGDEINDEIDFDASQNASTDGTVVLVLQDNERYASDDLEVEFSGDLEDLGGPHEVAFAAESYDEDLTQDIDSYQGTTIAFYNDTGDEITDYTIENDDYFQNYGSGDNSSVFYVDTDNLETEEYELDDTTYNLTVRDLGLSIDLDETNVTTDEEIEGTVEARASSRPITIELLEDGDAVDGETIDNIQLNGQGEYDFSIDASDLDTGDYTVEVTDDNSFVSSESSTVTVSEAADEEASFENNVVTDQRGDILEFTVEMTSTDTATVVFGSESDGVNATATVIDDDDDGEVTVYADTFNFNNSSADGQVFALDDDSDDEIETRSVHSDPLENLIDAGDYDLDVRAGDDYTDDSDDVATVTLEQRSTDAFRTWTAPESVGTPSDLEDINEGLDEGEITQSSDVANGDVVIHQLEASGFEGAFDARDQEDITDEFFTATGNFTDLTVEEADPGANQDADVLQLDSENATVIADGENDTYFIAYDSDAVTYENGNSIEDDTALDAEFTVINDDDSTVPDYTSEDLDDDENETISATFEVTEPTITVDTPYNVSNAEGQTVSGTTSLAPGTELTLRVRSDDGVSPSFLKTASPVVQEDRTWSAEMDFSEQAVGDTYEIVVNGGNADEVDEDGAVVESVGTATPEPDTDTPEPDTDTPEPDTDTPEPDTDTPEPDTETPTSTPGFGVVVALTALLAAALLAIRRD
ncbi:DUF7827 domain-containing protein [Halobellus marinus]|uniref:DUF7827 domain-containing protein n=1 Tax=Halobellus sp. GCM10025813 TaxID=3252665 RepID=UPI00361316DF